MASMKILFVQWSVKNLGGPFIKSAETIANKKTLLSKCLCMAPPPGGRTAQLLSHRIVQAFSVLQ